MNTLCSTIPLRATISYRYGLSAFKRNWKLLPETLKTIPVPSNTAVSLSLLWITSSGWWWAYGGSSDRWGMVGELMAHKLRVFEHNMDVWTVSISCNYVSDRGILLIYSPHPSSWSLFQDKRIRCSFGVPVFNVKFAVLDHFTTIFNVILLSKWCDGIGIFICLINKTSSRLVTCLKRYWEDMVKIVWENSFLFNFYVYSRNES